MLDGGGGMDRLVMDGNGLQAKAVTNFSTLTKIGSGTWTLQTRTMLDAEAFVTIGALDAASGLVVPRLTVGAGATFLAGGSSILGTLTNAGIVVPGATAAPGALTVTGDYIQGGGATLRLRVGAAGKLDRLQIGGTATLSGTLAIESLGRLPGGDYALLSFAGSNGGFTTVTAPRSAFMTSRIVTTPTGILLQVQRTPYASAALTGSQRSLADMLDRQTTPATSLVPLLDAIEQGGPAAAQLLFATLAPETVPAVTTLALTAMRAVERTALDTQASSSSGGRVRAWGQFLDRRGHTRAEIAADRYDSALSGGMAGFDLAVGESARVGLSLATTDSTARFAAGAESRLPMTVIGIAATDRLTGPGLQFQAQASYAGGTAGVQRTATLAGNTNRLTAAAGVNVWAMDGRASLLRVFGPVTIVPYAGLSVASVHVDGVDEGAALGLRTAPTRTDSLRSDIGARLEIAAGRLRSFAGMAWSQELLGNRRQVPATLIGATDTAFTLSGATTRRAQLEAEAGLAVDVLPGMSAYVRGGATLNDALAGRHVTAGVVWRW
jgi:outer membrane autotransporter protein